MYRKIAVGLAGLLLCASAAAQQTMNGSIIRPGTTPLNALQAVPPGAVVCNPTGSSAIPTACTSLPPAAIPPPTGATLGGVTSNTPASHQFATGINTSGAVTTAQPAATDVSGLAPSATTDTTNAGNISSGTLSSGRLPALAGDVTSSAGSATTTIATGAVTDTKASLANKPSVGLVATSNLALSGVQTIDGVTGTAGVTLVLATAQSTASQNGPWLMQSGAWTRPTWYPSGGTTQAIQFSEIKVRLGNTYQNSTWRLTTAAPITIDTTAQAWAVTPYNLNANTVTGTLPLGQLPFTGSPGATTFARGDGTWSSIYVNPSTLVSGQLKITTTGTAVCPPSAALSSGNITVTAADVNVAPLVVGTSSVTNTINGTGNGFVLKPGASVPEVAANASAVCVNGTAGDWFSYLGS